MCGSHMSVRMFGSCLIRVVGEGWAGSSEVDLCVT